MSWGITDVSVGACRQDGRRWAAGPGRRAGLKSRLDSRGKTGRLVTQQRPPWGCARPPVRGAWPRAWGSRGGPGSGVPAQTESKPLGAAVWRGCWMSTQGSVSCWSQGREPRTGGLAQWEQRGDCLSLPISRTEVTKAPNVSLQSAVNTCAWNALQPPCVAT